MSLIHCTAIGCRRKNGVNGDTPQGQLFVYGNQHKVYDVRTIGCMYAIYANIGGILMVNVTSSTAQGGGGSFKNRKPIGEIGCCESGMAERIH